MTATVDPDKTLEAGKIAIAVGHQDGKVVLTFSEKRQWIELDAEAARQIGESLAQHAYILRYGAPPPPMRSAIKEHTRNTLIQRFILVDRDLRARRKPPAYIAQQLVDLFLAEVS